ncbi:hypothetical protein LLE49_04520 [Alicyclobacillus tolerans]|uniref:hypothetical protein n=1 Tax=Alicyclobacillus tolerans TaxID=90970 RepID=UPI001F3118F2|nr:hypothetical protein [Alicyclobacillus tolerans]MCF8564000.1 hypothetical protein [Alicyclobacillus tolerans]
MLSSIQSRVNRLWRWLGGEQGGIMDEFIVTTGMWIFSSVVVMILAGLIWAALSGDVQAMTGVLQNLF